jgi:hypothetical protein
MPDWRPTLRVPAIKMISVTRPGNDICHADVHLSCQKALWSKCSASVTLLKQRVLGRPGEMVVQKWANFIAKHPHAHVLLGRTRNITQWRSTAVVKLIRTQNPSGKFSLKRDLDDEQGYYLILVGFELETDATKLAHLLGATKVEAYAGYTSAFEIRSCSADS